MVLDMDKMVVDGTETKSSLPPGLSVPSSVTGGNVSSVPSASQSGVVSSSSTDRTSLAWWTPDETHLLLSLRGEPEFVAKFAAMKRNRPVWNELASRMRQRGFNRTARQCAIRFKNLIVQYKTARQMHLHHGGAPHALAKSPSSGAAGGDADGFSFFPQMDQIINPKLPLGASGGMGGAGDVSGGADASGVGHGSDGNSSSSEAGSPTPGGGLHEGADVLHGGPAMTPMRPSKRRRFANDVAAMSAASSSANLGNFNNSDAYAEAAIPTSLQTTLHAFIKYMDFSQRSMDVLVKRIEQRDDIINILYSRLAGGGAVLPSSGSAQQGDGSGSM